MTETIIALDAMGGDHGPSVVVPAAIMALKQHPDLRLILVGDKAILFSHLEKHQEHHNPHLDIHHTTEVVEMDEMPALALRNKKDSSMRVSIDLVKALKAHAAVSAGNTGALMATARFVLKTIPGIDRPAIITSFPTVKRKKIVRMLDLGGNVDSSPEHLVQFAVMGSVVAKAVDGIVNPKIGLLNIGSEAIKGNEQIKNTTVLLESQRGINYAGFVEADGIYSGKWDVVVCDGFVGNIALKASEGTIKLLMHYLKKSFLKNFLTKMVAFLAKPIIADLKSNIDPANYNGASFIGLKGIVVKSHGGAQVAAFANAISEAVALVGQNVPEKIQNQVADLLNSQEKI